MCGIFGYTKYTNATPGIASILAVHMENRGKDSWGKAAFNPSATLVIDKDVGTITNNWQRALPKPNDLAAIYHTRAASTGKVTKENAHPFIFTANSGAKIVGTHNGIVNNHASIDAKYNRDFDVDSMHIFANIAEGKPTEELNGWGALAWLVHTAEHTFMCWCRFNTPDLHFAVLGEEYGIYYASETDALKQAVAMFAPKADAKFCYIEPETLYFCDVRNSPHKIEKAWKMEFGYRYARPTHTWPQTYAPTTQRSVSKCAICKEVELSDENHTVCIPCLYNYTETFKKVTAERATAAATT